MDDETPNLPEKRAPEIERCGAQTRKEGEPPCENYAGLRTAHFGKGRCYLHGGVQPGDGRLQYARYSQSMRQRFAELQVEFENDPDPLDMLPEVWALRALYIDWVNRYDEFTDALIQWHYSFTTGEAVKKPAKVLDISEGYKMLDTISKVIERIESIKQRRTITVISPEVQDRIHAQVDVIMTREKWDRGELLTALSSIWTAT